jgi:hypothetical protein
MASINCPITKGTLWIRFISSCARTSSLFKLLHIVSFSSLLKQLVEPVPLLILDVLFLKLDVSAVI